MYQPPPQRNECRLKPREPAKLLRVWTLVVVAARGVELTTVGELLTIAGCVDRGG